jgi:OOP family OmpA-OmpF porin
MKKNAWLYVTGLSIALLSAGCATQSSSPASEAKPAPAAPTTAAAASAAAKPAVQAPARKKIDFTMSVYFNPGRPYLDKNAKAELDDLATRLQDIKLDVIFAIGYTDSVGSARAKQKRGLKEANAVKEYLMSKGIAANQIYADTYGDKKPVASNKKAAGRAKNRRVEIEVIGYSTK